MRILFCSNSKMENWKDTPGMWTDPEKVICIVHGIGEYGGRFDRVAEAFREKNMAVLAFDLRGHGKSLGKRGHCAPRKDVLSDVSTFYRVCAGHLSGKEADIIWSQHGWKYRSAITAAEGGSMERWRRTS